jgi:nucleoside recognition membrane protein YjiH
MNQGGATGEGAVRTEGSGAPTGGGLDLASILRFLVPTLIGMGMFLVPLGTEEWIRIGERVIPRPTLPHLPLADGESVTIGIGVLADALSALLGDLLVPLGVAVLCLSVLVTVVARVADPAWMRAEGWREIFHVGSVWFGLRVAGALLGLMTMFEIGPDVLRGGATGGVILNDLIPVLLTFFLFALMALPFLVEFGLMEFIGTIVRKPFRKIFGLPGRSAIDATASWMGAAPLGVLITYQQYERGYYSQREASVIATNFSVASIAFSLLIAGFIGLDHMFVQMYFTVVVAGLTAAIVMPRIPPLSGKPDEYYAPVGKRLEEPERAPGVGVVAASLGAATGRAKGAPGPKALSRGVLLSIGDIFFGLLPLVMAIGTAALALAEHTPVFTWISYPMVPVLELLRLPEAAAAAPATLVGFADMFLPAVLLTSVESELTRFVIGCLSLTQLIYMSEIGVLILKSKIPLSFGELVVIFGLRTAITLPIIALMAHTLFY